MNQKNTDWYSEAVELLNDLTGGRVSITLASAHLQGIPSLAERSLFVDNLCGLGRGFQRKVLSELCRLADTARVVLLLDAFDPIFDDDDEVWAWYGQFAFVPFANHLMQNGMVRYPAKKR